MELHYQRISPAMETPGDLYNAAFGVVPATQRLQTNTIVSTDTTGVHEHAYGLNFYINLNYSTIFGLFKQQTWAQSGVPILGTKPTMPNNGAIGETDNVSNTASFAFDVLNVKAKQTYFKISLTKLYDEIAKTGDSSVGGMETFFDLALSFFSESLGIQLSADASKRKADAANNTTYDGQNALEPIDVWFASKAEAELVTKNGKNAYFNPLGSKSPFNRDGATGASTKYDATVKAAGGTLGTKAALTVADIEDIQAGILQACNLAPDAATTGYDTVAKIHGLAQSNVRFPIEGPNTGQRMQAGQTGSTPAARTLGNGVSVVDGGINTNIQASYVGSAGLFGNSQGTAGSGEASRIYWWNTMGVSMGGNPACHVKLLYPYTSWNTQGPLSIPLTGKLAAEAGVAIGCEFVGPAPKFYGKTRDILA